MKVRVYRNLHKQLWSVRQKGLVIDRLPSLCLVGCKFVVQPAGRARALREGRKNVHAFVDGTVARLNVRKHKGRLVRLHYNPTVGSFFRADDGKPVSTAGVVFLTAKGECLALYPS